MLAAMANALELLRHRFHEGLAHTFERWGRLVSRHPLKVLLASVVFFIGLFSLNIFMVPEFRANYLWSPVSSPAYENWEYMKAHYGERNHLVLYARRPDGGNMLELGPLKELLKAHEWTVSKCFVDEGGRRLRWKDVCHKHKGERECASQSFLGLWGYDATALEARSDSILDDVSTFHRHVATADVFAGRATYDGAGDDETVEGAEGLMLVYELEGVDGDAYAFESAWNAGIEAAVNPRVLDIAHVSPRSYDDETNRLVFGDMPLFGLGLLVILLYLVLSLGPIRSLVHSRVLLGCASFVNMVIALGGGFGLASAFGVPLAPIAPLLPLIIAGVQVDSVIIMVDYLNAQSSEDALEERVARSFRESGPAILTTTITTVSAFAVGSTVDMPGVRYFCLFAAASFAVSALAIFSFFLSLLVLDERRLRAGRVSFAPCVVAVAQAAPPAADGVSKVEAPAPTEPSMPAEPSAEPRPTGPLGRWVARYYAPTLLRPAASATVVLVFLVLGGLSIASVPTLKLGMPDADILPDDSYVQHTLRVEQETFGGQRLQASVVVRNESFRTHAVVQAVDRALDEMQSRPYVTFGFDRWHVLYKKHLQAQQEQPSADDFTDELHDWLDDHAQWQDDVVCESDESCKSPLAGRYTLLYTKPASGSAIDSINRRDQLERALERRGLSESFVFHFTFLINEGDVVIWELVVTNLVSAMLAIFGIMLLFTPPLVALWIVLCVFSINVQLVGMMWAVGVPLNPIAFVNLVMSVGLSVDYCVHIAITYDAALIAARKRGELGRDAVHAAVVYALVQMGVSVLKGGWTTILGIFVLAFASSVVFRTFFTMLVFVVILGVLHGCVLLPVLLAYASTLPDWRSPRGSSGERRASRTAAAVGARAGAPMAASASVA